MSNGEQCRHIEFAFGHLKRPERRYLPEQPVECLSCHFALERKNRPVRSGIMDGDLFSKDGAAQVRE
jgi:hypothetical protein